jgi:hypothetical protein
LGEIVFLSGLQERLHFSSNLIVVGTKPHEVTLGFRDKKARLGKPFKKCIMGVGGWICWPMPCPQRDLFAGTA